VTRNRGKWASPTQAQRGSPIRGFSLPKDLHAVLDRLIERKIYVSPIVDEALRAHPIVKAALEAIAAEAEAGST
jgi:hypothetical protein